LKKIYLSLMLCSLLNGAKLEFGHGKVDLTGGILGLQGTISDNINTYSFIIEHDNLFSSNLFYSLDLTLLDSNKLKQITTPYMNNLLSNTNNLLSKRSLSQLRIPEMEHTIQGADLGLGIGYDLINADDRNYLGIGLYIGASLPYISSSKSSKEKIDLNSINANYFLDSDTDILTYKLGVGLYAQKSLGDVLDIYTKAIYAYQNANVSNSYANLDIDVNGKYLEYGAGLNIRFAKLSKNFYVTIGAKHKEWDIGKVGVNISGTNLFKTPKSNMKIKSEVITLGVGYSF